MFYHQLLQSLASHFKFDINAPFKDLPDVARRVILYGSGAQVVDFRYQDSSQLWKTRKPFEGVIPNLKRRFLETSSEHSREEIEAFMSNRTCESCKGARLRPESLHVKVGQRNIHEVTTLSIGEAINFFRDLDLKEKEREIGSRILKEIKERLGFLRDVGLDYLTGFFTSSTNRASACTPETTHACLGPCSSFGTWETPSSWSNTTPTLSEDRIMLWTWDREPVCGAGKSSRRDRLRS
jgi:excinuclease ABC subunit A